MLPRVLKNFAVFADGRGYAGRCDEVELPKLALKTDELRAGGMDAPVELDMGMEKLEAKLTFAEYDEAALGLFGKPNTYYTLRGAAQRQGEAAQPVILRLFGTAKEVDSGSWKAGERGSMAFMIAVTKLTYEVNGVPIVVIDVENMIRIVNGVDQLATQRAALGI